MKILLINGPNLNMLGTREPEKYGNLTLDEIVSMLTDYASAHKTVLESFQSNHEGEIIDKIQKSSCYDGVLINAGGYSHTSVAIRDAIASVKTPFVEIHMTNIHSREEFRHTSLLTPVCVAQVIGFKEKSYSLALEGLIDFLNS